MAKRSSRTMAMAPLTGVIFVVLTVASFVIGGEPPDPDEPVGEIVAYWVDNENAAFVASLIEAVAVVALVFFAASLHRALAHTEAHAPANGTGSDAAASSVLPMAAFGGGLIAAAGIGVDGGLRFAAAELAGEVDPAVIQAVHAIWSEFFLPMVIGLVTLILATSLAIFRTHVLPQWLGVVGVVICVASFSPAGYLALLASGAWVIAVSVLLWRRESVAAAAR